MANNAQNSQNDSLVRGADGMLYLVPREPKAAYAVEDDRFDVKMPSPLHLREGAGLSDAASSMRFIDPGDGASSTRFLELGEGV